MTIQSTRRQRLPLTVIGGFLGAGKTTLLNRMLRESQDRRLAVLVNDFGALNIDAALVASKASDVIALTNGCICCSIGNDLTSALMRVLASSIPFDAVLIEASGVSDPWRIAQVALADPELSLDGVIVLVDASACLTQAADPLLADSLQRQLKGADLLVVNKTDLVDSGERQRVREWLTSAARATPCFETTEANLPMLLLSSSALSTDDHAHLGAGDESACSGHDGTLQVQQSAGHHADHGHGELFSTWSIQPRREFSAKALRGLLRDMPADVLRLKGIVRTDEHDWAELQFAGRHGSLRNAPEAPASGAAIVAIGLRDRLPAKALDAAFQASLSESA
jgi:G3E family GTPase